MKSVDYTVGENLVMLLIFVFTRYRLVTHRQTYIQTALAMPVYRTVAQLSTTEACDGAYLCVVYSGLSVK